MFVYYLVWKEIYLNNISIGDIFIATTSPIWTSRISGIPTTKYQCLVLCLKIYIPAIDPNDPPITATRNSVASGILHFLRFALDLSTPIRINPKRLTATKYIMMINHISFIVAPYGCKSSSSDYLFSLACAFIARTFVERPKRLMKPSAS